MTAAHPVRFVLAGIAEGLIFSLLFCVLGVLTLKLASGPDVLKDPPAALAEVTGHVPGP